MESTKYEELRLLRDEPPDISDSDAASENALLKKSTYPKRFLIHLFLASFINILLIVLVLIFIFATRTCPDPSIGTLYSNSLIHERSSLTKLS
jgi:hypothetical protein